MEGAPADLCIQEPAVDPGDSFPFAPLVVEKTAFRALAATLEDNLAPTVNGNLHTHRLSSDSSSRAASKSFLHRFATSGPQQMQKLLLFRVYFLFSVSKTHPP